jgi:hypothetical protein
LVQTSSPFSPAHRLAFVVPDLDRHAQAAALDSPRHTGRTGQPSTKQETMSVPPEIEASCRSSLMLR